MKAYIIIPTYNEAKNIGPLIAEILEASPGIQVVVVDEKSSDGTAPLARMMQAQHPDYVQVLHSHMLRDAYVAGFRLALAQGATHVLTMDADFTHPPAALPNLLAADADLVIASRYLRGSRIRRWGWWTRFRAGRLNSFARKHLGLSPKDCLSSFRCYRREALERVSFDELRSDGAAFQVELLAKIAASGPVAEVPVSFDARKQDASKWSARMVREARRAIAQLSCRPI